MVKTEHGIKYAVHLVSTQFGNLVAKVCEYLLRKGPLTLQNIVRYTELSQTQAKNSLLVLIQHNCVQAFRLEDSGGGFQATQKQTTQYVALFDNILHRQRLSKFLTIVSQEFESDKLCVQIVEGLLQHGRLSLKQIVDRANSQLKEGNRLGLDTIHEKLGNLLKNRFVERCPDPEPFVAPPTEEEIAAKKRSAKSSKIVVESQTLEDRVLAAAVPIDAKRFLPIEQNGGENDQTNLDKHAGDKRKLDASEPDINSEVAEDQHVLWRANFEEFIRRLRHKACVEHVRGRLDDVAAIVLSTMLKASRTEEKKVKAARSVSLSISSIFDAIQSEKGHSLTIDHIRAALVELTSPPPLVMKNEDDDYNIDIKLIIEEAQRNEVESIVSKRYGQDAYKMFRLLSKAGRLLETNKISDTVFVDKKETAKVLYKMWQDDYLQMEKLVVGNGSYLLWKVKQNVVWEHVVDEMCHAALNLSLRLSYELEQRKEIVNLPPNRREEGPMREKYEKLTKMRLLMGSSLMKLDDAIMLFHDF